MTLPDDSAAPPVARPTFNHIYRTQLPFIQSTLRWLGVASGDIEDVQQNVLLAVHGSLHRFDPLRYQHLRECHPGWPPTLRRLFGDHGGWNPVSAWLFGVIWRQVSHYRARSYRRHEVPSGVELPRAHLAAEAVSPELAAQRAERADLVDRLLERVSVERRAILILHDVLGAPVTDIARELQLKENTARNRLRLARNELRAAVKRLDAERRSALRLGAVLPLPLGAFWMARAEQALREPPGPALVARIGRCIARAAGVAARALAALRPAELAAGLSAGLALGAVVAAPAWLQGCDPTAPPARAASPAGLAPDERPPPGPPTDTPPATQAPVGAQQAPPPPHYSSPGSSGGIDDVEQTAGPTPAPRPPPAPALAVEGPSVARPPRPRDAEDERALLADAYAAYARGELATALDRLGAHAARFPRSRFAGPRDRLRGRVIASAARSSGEPPPSP